MKHSIFILFCFLGLSVQPVTSVAASDYEHSPTAEENIFHHGWVELNIEGSELCYRWTDQTNLPSSICRSNMVLDKDFTNTKGKRTICMSFKNTSGTSIRVPKPCARIFLSLAAQVEQYARIKRGEAVSTYRTETAATIRQIDMPAQEAQEGA